MATRERSVSWRLKVEGDEIAVQKLTGVGSSARKAIEPVPGLLRGVSAASQEFQSGLSGMAGRLGIAGAALAAMGPVGAGVAATLVTLGVAANAAFSHTREADEFADSIERIAQHLRLGTAAFQELVVAGKQYNLEQGQIVSGVSVLRENVAQFIAGTGGARGIGQVFKTLGLSREQLAGAGGVEQQINLIADALARIQNIDVREGLADRLGVTDLLPMLQTGQAGLDKLRESARQSGQVVDQTLVKSGADANREYEKLAIQADTKLKSAFIGLSPVTLAWQRTLAGAAKILADIVQTMVKLENRSSDSLTSRYRDDLNKIAEIKKALDAQGGDKASGIGATGLRAQLVQLQSDADRITVELGKRFGEKMGPYNLASIQPKVNGKLPPTREDEAAAAAKARAELDAAEQSLNRAFQLSEQREAFLAQMGVGVERATAERINAENAANVEILRGKKGYYEALLKQADDAARAEIATIEAQAKVQIAALDRMKRDYEANGQKMPGYESARLTIEQDAVEKIGGVNARRLQDHASIARDARGAIGDLVAEINGPLDKAMQQVGANGLNSLTDALTGISTGAEDAGEAIGNMVDSIISDMARLVIQRTITAPLAGALDGFLGGIFGGGHADGGGMRGGMVSRINERGGFPETFYSSQGDGYVLSSPTSLNTVVQMVTRQLGPRTVIAAPAAPPKVEVHNHGEPMSVSQSYDAGSNTTRIDLRRELRDATVNSTRRGDMDRAMADRFGTKPIPKRRN